MKIYAISGLGADERVFNSLKLDYDLEVLPWKPFSKDDTMNSYALKMIEGIDLLKPYGFIGVSFGGMLVSELSKNQTANFYILVSSVFTRSELPWWFKLNIPFYKLPTFIFEITKTWVRVFFGAKNSPLIKRILKESDPIFIKNAIRLIINWQSNLKGEVYRIHGDHDLIIPRPDKSIPSVKGGHFVIVDKATEISTIINLIIKKVINKNT